MSTMLRSWWMTLLLALAVAIISLPTPAPETTVWNDPLRRQATYARARFGLQSELLRRADSREIARGAAARRVGNADSTVVIRMPGVPADAEDRVRREVNLERRHFLRLDSTVRVVVAIAIDTGAMLAGTLVENRGGWPETSLDIFPPGSVDRNTCVDVVRIHARWILDHTREGSWEDQRGQLLGACKWFAQYGVPGSGVGAWLDSTNFAAIAYPGSDYFGDSYYWRDDWLPDGPSRFAAASCSLGRAQWCSAMLLGSSSEHDRFSERVVRTPDWLGRGRDWAIQPDWNAAAMLRRLERELGPAAMHTFWTSEASMTDAFRATHGGSMLEWVRVQATRNVPPKLPRSLPPVGTLAVLLMAVGTLLFGAIRAVRNRSGFA